MVVQTLQRTRMATSSSVIGAPCEDIRVECLRRRLHYNLILQRPIYNNSSNFFHLTTIMDFVNKLTGNKGGNNEGKEQSSGSGGFMGSVNNSLGGGQKGEQNEGTLIGYVLAKYILTRLRRWTRQGYV